MNTDELKKVIAKNIKANGKGEITGPVLQSVLIDMVNGLQTDGLGFLGIINPGDPAPSNKKVNGYYLSFAVNNEVYPEAKKWKGEDGIMPYFNGATLNRYCMFIWTQDENGKWQFKRIKYEDHTRKDGVVIGRGLPIWYNEDDGSYTLHLSPDGTMLTYAVCGFSPLRNVANSHFVDKKQSPQTCLFFMGQRGGEDTPNGGYRIIHFHPEDDRRTFATMDELREFLETRKTSLSTTDTASPNYTILYDRNIDEYRILWTPQTFRHPVYFKRVARNQKYFDAESNWESRRDIHRNWWISWRMCDPYFDGITKRVDNGIIRDSKRTNVTDISKNPSHSPRDIQRGGVSDNFIVFSNGVPKLPYRR